MAHKRKDTLARVVPSCGWWKHLRKYGKRLQAKAERRATQREIVGMNEYPETTQKSGLPIRQR